MAVKGTFPIRVESNLQGYWIVLRLAVCEWLLLFFLLLDAAFSYFLTKFAQYCELQLPCILCSRIDHILGKEKPDIYNSLLCNDHRLEISSCVTCHNHGKLADVHGMCEECLLSFAKKETNEETCKLLMGKLGPQCLQKPFSNVDSALGSLTTRSCSCCSKPWRARPNVQKLVHSKPSASVSKPDIPSVPKPKSPGYRSLNRQDGVKKRKDRFSVSTTPLVLASPDFDALSHVGYTEVKIHSDSDSDFIFSDDDDFVTATRDHKISKDDFLFQDCSNFLPQRQHDNVHPAEQIPKSSHTSSILLRPELQPEKGETTTPKFPLPNGGIKSNFSEINWQQICKMTNPVLPEFTSLDNIPLSSNAPEISAVRSMDEVDRIRISEKLSGSGLSKFTDKIDSLPANIVHQPAPRSDNMHVPAIIQSNENWSANNVNGGSKYSSAQNNWESIDLNSTTTVVGLKSDSSRKDSSVAISSCSTNDPRDLSSSTSKEVKASEFSEFQTGDSHGIELAEEPSVSKASTSGMDSVCDDSRVVNGHADRSHTSEGPEAPQTVSKSPSLERSSSLELQERNVGEYEGENLVDKLRQEIENDKKRISDLYKELEEERNAAAVAANQAMAMITKLQEEKAALNMEALQYLRMMEEQAEYDVEALEKANDMIAEKDKEIQDLQAELDYYRIKYPEEFEEEFAEDSDIIGLDVQGSYTESIEFEKS